MPFIFKRAIDTMTSGSTSAAVGWMLVYGMSRGVYTLLQEPHPPYAIGCAASPHCLFSYTELHRLTVHWGIFTRPPHHTAGAALPDLYACGAERAAALHGRCLRARAVARRGVADAATRARDGSLVWICEHSAPTNAV